MVPDDPGGALKGILQGAEVDEEAYHRHLEEKFR